MKRAYALLIRRWLAVAAGIVVVWIPGQVGASPFGQGVFSADVPFGSATSIAIALGGDVTIPLTWNGSVYTGTGAHTLTVTSTDVVGYTLYAHATTTTDMVNGSATIPASSNGTAAALATGTWGYNTTGSTTNFLGMPTGGAMLKDANGPFKNGDATTVTYGAVTSAIQAAGSYSLAMTYTVVARNP